MFTQSSRRARSRWLAVALVLAAAAVVLLNSTVARPVRGITARLTAPLQASLSRLGNSLREMVATVDDLATLRRRNAELEALVASLTIENLRLTEVEAENERLRRLLDFANATAGNSYRGGQVVGRVLSREPGSLVEAVLIDLGERHGIRVGMPVVTERGLVGRVSEVYGNTSRVLLITDSDSMVNAMLQNSRLRGVLRGRANQPPVLDYLPPDQPVPVGDIVLTSGEAGNFPAGIPIGQVISVEHNDVEMFQRAVVRTTVDFNSLENVLVVTNFVPIPDLAP